MTSPALPQKYPFIDFLRRILYPHKCNCNREKSILQSKDYIDALRSEPIVVCDVHALHVAFAQSNHNHTSRKKTHWLTNCAPFCSHAGACTALNCSLLNSISVLAYFERAYERCSRKCSTGTNYFVTFYDILIAALFWLEECYCHSWWMLSCSQESTGVHMEENYCILYRKPLRTTWLGTIPPSNSLWNANKQIQQQ